MEGYENHRYKLKQIIIIVILLIVSIVIVYCYWKSFKLPNEKDFSLKLSVDKTVLKAGDEIKAMAVFKNSASKNYNCTSTASFSKSGLIHIYLFRIDEDECILVGVDRNVKIGANKEIYETQKFKIDKPGKYKIVASSIFYILAPNNKRLSQKYVIKAEKLIVNVK